MEEIKKPTEIIKIDPIPELTTATEGLNNINSLADNILNTVSSWKQMERDMHQMDVQFNAYLAKLDADLEQYKISAPIVSKQLDRVNDLMSRILDKVVDMDVKTELDMQNGGDDGQIAVGKIKDTKMCHH